MGKNWPKRPSDCQLQEAQKKTLTGPLLLQQRQSMSLHTWYRQGSHKPSSCATFTLNSHWGRAATGKKSLASMHTGLLQLCPALCEPVDCGLPGFCQGQFSRQEYWSVLANTGCHTLLKHYISCCPSRQPPEYLMLPEPLQPKQLHHLHTSQGQTHKRKRTSSDSGGHWRQ